MAQTQKKYNIGSCNFNNAEGLYCYQNSIISILSQTFLFVDYICMKSYEFLKIKKNDLNLEVTDTLTYQLSQILNSSLSNDNKTITPTSFRKICGKINPIWAQMNYQDSQEFFNFVISRLKEEMGKKIKFIPGKNMIKYKQTSNNTLSNLQKISALFDQQNFIKKEFSPLTSMFNGILHNQKECEFCKYISNSYQPFNTLPLEIPKNKTNLNILDCLDEFIKIEKLNLEDRMKCDFCKRKNQASEKAKIWTPPKILAIHLKRFKMNNYGIVYRKDDTPIDYPIYNLNISKYISKNSPYQDKCEYNLFAVNIHTGFGLSINSGHYYSIVKNRLDNNWYVWNDSMHLHKIEANQPEKIINKEGVYLLFYLRKD
jgi:ubiquitin carboxyl-terminal hydrolase 8